MKKLLSVVVLLTLLLGGAPSGFADKKLTSYTLLVNAEPVSLSSSTGYIAKTSNGRLMLPLKKICQELGLETKMNGKKKQLTVTLNSGKKLVATSGSKVIKVGSSKKTLKSKCYMQSGKVLMADAGILSYMGYTYRKAATSSDLIARGYKGSVVSIGKKGTTPKIPALPDSSAVSKLDAAQETDQIIYVQYKGGSKAKVSMYQKNKYDRWTLVKSANGYVGKNGIDKKKEGDKRTPTGTYNLTQAFGILKDPGTALPYVKVTKYHYWCGDSTSKYYNQLIDTRVTGRKRTSKDEYLINYKGAYNYAIFIDYNKEGTPYKGSCIFLHCSTGRATAGCVSVPQSTMVTFLRKLKPGAKIVIE